MSAEQDSQTDQPQSDQQQTEDAENGDQSSLEDDFNQLQAEYEELENKLKRTHADFQNYKKRVQERREQDKQRAIRSLIEDLLPYLDNQELALDEADDYESLRESIELNHDQLLDILTDHGVEPIDTNGRFDPTRHEATLTEPTDDEDKHNHVVDELRTGYRIGDNVLRHAQVTIARYNDTDKSTSKEENQ